jgi:hypothetical protein
MKTEYHESRQIQVSLASHVQQQTYHAIATNLNIALIDTLTGVDSNMVLQNLNTCRLHIKGLTGLDKIVLGFQADQIFADLALRDGDHMTAYLLFAQIFTLSRDICMEEALVCLSRLADLSAKLGNAKTTMHWAGILLILALKSEDKHSLMKSFLCLGQIFVAQGDDETALSLFNVALEGLTFMDVHQWMADCMVRIADIFEHRGESMKSVKLWKEARALFERSSQSKDVIRIDMKLTAVVDFKETEQLQELAE